MGYSLGVDVGTTFTAAAVAHEGHIEMVSLGTHQLTAPTVVFAAGDEVVFGNAALLRGRAHPAGLAREFKRRVGDPVPLVLSGTPYSAARLVALYAQWVVETVTTQRGEEPQALVMTYPANWTEYQLHLLRQSFDEVGLGETTFLTEPEAGAIDYVSAVGVQPGELYLVYDLGGGTFDVALLRKEQRGFTQLGEAAGLERLGGIDFDEAVFQHVIAQLPPAVVQRMRDEDQARAVGQLRQACIDAKEGLSSEVAVDIPVVLPELSTTIRLTRQEFEAMIRPTVLQTVGLVRRVLDSSGVQPSDLAGVLLVGGSSRIPLISQVVGEELGVPTRVDAHPKLVVARGAATASRDVRTQSRGASATPRPDGGGGRRTKLLVAGAAAVVVLAAAGIVVATQRGDDDPATNPSGTAAAASVPTAPTAPTTPATSPATAAPSTATPTSPPSTVPVVPDLSLAEPVAVPDFPDMFAFDGDELWLTTTGGRVLARLDPATGEVRGTVDVGPDPVEVVFDQDDGLWVSLRGQGVVARYDPTTGEELQRVEFPDRRPTGLAVGGGSLWVTMRDGLAHVDIASGEITEIPIPDAGAMHLTDDTLWVARREERVVVPVDVATRSVGGEQFPTGENPDTVVVADGVMWVANRGTSERPGDTVARIDMATGDTTLATVGAGPSDIAVDGERVWVTSVGTGTLSLLHAPTAEVLLTEEVGPRPLDILVHDGGLWVSLADADQVRRVDVG
jgi:actin-like ATPase involved in cell morphogenesis/streptogramin lyase